MMRGKLFWKILFGFWLTFIAISQIMWVTFMLYANNKGPYENRIAARIITLQMNSAESVLSSGGIESLNHLISTWPESERVHFSVQPLDEAGFLTTPNEPDIQAEQVIAPSGQRYMLKYDVEGLRKEFRPKPGQFILNMPKLQLWIGALGGLVFSLLLAWHLTRPMRYMRKGFHRVAQGDLDVRLYPMLKRRHDEIGDMARDFDSMVERLKLLVSAREALLHDVSHELRSPLARLQLAIGLARQNPQNVETALDRIEQESGRLDKMIGELLTLSRAEAAGIDDDQYFELYGLLETVVNDACYESQSTGVDVRLTVDDEPTKESMVKGNAELMRRAVENLVRNALKFSIAGQHVSVSLRQQENLLSIQVIDRGPGVDKDKLSSIFDPFVRVKSQLSGKGYGLGLAIARKVVNAHGGTIDAQNGLKSGLVITITLPLCQI